MSNSVELSFRSDSQLWQGNSKIFTKGSSTHAERVSRDIEQKLTKGDIRGAYDLLHGWYKTRSGKPPRPT